MNKKLRLAMTAALLAAMFGAMPLHAEPAPSAKQPTPARKPEDQHSVREGRRDRGERFLDRLGRFRAIDKHERDHESVRGAFREVVHDSHKATVRVLADDKPAALGSIVDADGYILTKASELRGQLTVKLHDNRLFDAELIGIDRKTDLAMLKIEASKLPVVAWRDSRDVPSVGSFLASTGLETLPVAIGVVSVQPRLIAAPSGVLGVVLEEDNGARVVEIVSDSGADKAGIKPGDRVLKVNGQRIKSRDQLIETVRQFQPRETLKLEVKRGSDRFEVEATLGERPTSPDHDRKDFQNMLGGPLSERRNGFPLALQHDTVLTPQDCGGPLVDLDGRCVGINIARAGRVNSYALPVSVVAPLVAEFKAGKYSPEPSADSLKLELAKRWEQLKKSETTLASKLSKVGETLRQLQAADDADAQARIKEARAEQAAAETELGKVKAELSKLENQKTSLQK